MRIRAAVLSHGAAAAPYSQSRPLEIADVDLDGPTEGEVLVRIRAAGLCHSDLSVIDGNRPRPLPMVLGHEASGTIEEIGPGVKDFVVGDHVVTTFVPSCGQCTPCVGGRPALCEPGFASNSSGTLLSGAKRLHRSGGDLHHHLGVSAFAEYATVSQQSLVRVDKTLSFEEAAVFGCAVITGAGAVINTAQLGAGRQIAVIGLGGVGLAALLGTVYRESTTIVAVDRSAAKLELARRLGATHVFSASDPHIVEGIRDVTRGGVEFAFEMAGAAQAMDLAYRITRRGGTTVTAGLPHPQVMFAVPHVNIVAEERTIKGSYLGSCVPARDIPRYIQWFQEGRLPIDRLLAGTMRLEDINTGFDLLAKGEALRQTVLM